MTQTFDATFKIVFHDYGGHAFTAHIAREMARRGVRTHYMSFGSFATPKGKVDGRGGDPELFSAEQLSISAPFDKENLIRRRQQQIEYARVAAAKVLEQKPDVVFSSNSPLEVQQHLMRACRTIGAKFVFWVQDIHSEAIGQILGRKNALLGRLAGSYYRMLERRLLRQSDGVIVISEAFRDMLGGWGLDAARMTVVENWAPLEDIPVLPRDNDWALRHMRADRTRIVYSGTMARKHNPDMLLHLARNLDVDVHLFSEGVNADYVRRSAAEQGLDNVFVQGWVPVDDLPGMLAGADILYAVIEREAGAFSVPSKVLSYLAAGRPILASIPAENLSSRKIARAEAGLVSSPDDVEALLADARTLLADAQLRQRMGANGRRYAEAEFDVTAIGERFVTIIEEAMGQPLNQPSPQPVAPIGARSSA
ncbi:glycosyltransferase family 4 protein [Devosia sp. Root635]|uniref:glycosyltransferase family 4 protein n=1 Tax=Devosia sp. Root635 TaxID=1736575 RepID=UPI0006FE3283|nr:glycosyltransferase family 4 protein [Devosia sp. Root635]KRA45696.1 hypothetical protein ASD80_05060 [Devosia sp. Root635]